MRALVFDGSLHFLDLPVPQPGKGEALVKVLYSSICNTDLEIIKGYMNFGGILGHEFMGEVVSSGSRFFGQKVVGEINCSCGECYMCLTGRRRHCTGRTVLGIHKRPGVFAEYTVLPEENLHRIPEGVADTAAVFIEPLAAAAGIFEQVYVKNTQNVFVFGAGKLGLLVSQVCRIRGYDFQVFDIHESKIAKARDMGLNARLLSDLAPSEKAEVCIDCTGNPEGISIALARLYPKGTLVLKTTVSDTGKIDLNQVVINEFTIAGSRCGSFPPALDLLSKKYILTEPMVSGIFDFSDIMQAFRYSQQPSVHKVLIKHT